MNVLTLDKNTLTDKEAIRALLVEHEKEREQVIIKQEELIIKQQEDNKKYYLSCLDEVLKKIKDSQTIVARMKSSKKSPTIDGIEKHIYNILNYRAVEKILLYENGMDIYTTTLYINEPVRNKRYLLGKMKIFIPYNINVDIYFDNLSGTRDGYSSGMQHPHIFSDGVACLGTFADSFYKARANEDYFGTFLLALNFCRTVDINDEAGAYIGAWDEVDDKGNIIKEGNRNRFICKICGSEMDEDEYYRCEDCDAIVCRDCYCETNTGHFICENCANENYEWGEAEGVYIHIDDCYDIGGGFYSYDYVSRNFIKCVNCGEYAFKECAFIDDNDIYFCCEECANKYNESNDDLNTIENELNEWEEATLNETIYEALF